MDIHEILTEYGLTEKEIEVYTNLLSLGAVSLQSIAKRVKLPRTTIYNTLNYLSHKGLVSYVIKSGVRYYEAADPERLIERLKLNIELIQSVLPQLNYLKKSVKESRIEVYEGKRGLFTILTDIFKINQQLYYFGSYSLSKKVLTYLPKRFRTIRIEKSIPAKIIIEPSEEEEFHKRRYKKITEMRFLKSLKDFPCMIFIYGNKVAIYTLRGDIIGVIIENEEIVDAFKAIFDVYWSLSKPAKF